MWTTQNKVLVILGQLIYQDFLYVTKIKEKEK